MEKEPLRYHDKYFRPLCILFTFSAWMWVNRHLGCLDNVLIVYYVLTVITHPLSLVYLFIFLIFSSSSLKVDVCAAVSGVGIPSSVGKQLCTMWWNERGRQKGKAQRVGQ